MNEQQIRRMAQRILDFEQIARDIMQVAGDPNAYRYEPDQMMVQVPDELIARLSKVLKG